MSGLFSAATTDYLFLCGAKDMAQHQSKRNKPGSKKSKTHSVQEIMDTSATAQVQPEPPQTQTTTAIPATSSGRQPAKETNRKTNTEPSSTNTTAQTSNRNRFPNVTLSQPATVDKDQHDAPQPNQVALQITNDLVANTNPPMTLVPTHRSQLATLISSPTQLVTTLVKPLSLAPENVIGTKTNRFAPSDDDDSENSSKAAKRPKQQQESRTKKVRDRRVITLNPKLPQPHKCYRIFRSSTKPKTNLRLQHLLSHLIRLHRMTELKLTLKLHLHRTPLQITTNISLTSHHLVSKPFPTTHISLPNSNLTPEL